MNRRGAGRSLLLGFVSAAVFFAFAELALWLAGVRPLLDERDPFEGFSSAVRVFAMDPARGVYETTPRAVARSFNRQVFRAKKPSGGFRLFTLGGSSAYGFPYGAEVAFTHLLGDALAASWPDRTVEAVNASGMSYGSHRLRILAHEIAGYDPDALIVYEGHNEFIETRFFGALLSRHEALDPLRAMLHRWRLYSLMTRLIHPSPTPPPVPREGGTGALLGVDVIREEGAGRRDESKAAARATFEANLLEIEAVARRAGAKVVLCTVACNLKDWPPNQSLFDPRRTAAERDKVLGLMERASGTLSSGRTEELKAAKSAIDEAARVAPEHAGVWFLKGRVCEALSLWDEAQDAYRLARDADTQPSRALGSFNETVRDVAQRTHSPLVDVERAFEQASPHGLVGFNLVEDYVHPTPAGHRLIAKEIWRTMLETGMLGAPRTADDSLFDQVVGKSDAATAPRPGSESRTAELLYNQAYVLEHQGMVDQAIEKYRACLELAPGYYIAAFNLGRLLHTKRRPDLAAEQFRRALAAEPTHALSMIGLGMALIGMDRLDESRTILQRAVALDPGSSAAFDALGIALSLGGDLEGAANAFEKAVSLEHGNASALGHLGTIRLMRGRVQDAIVLFRESLSLENDQPRVRADLADALAAAGQLEEAERIYREALAVDPADSRAREGLEAVLRKSEGLIRN